MLIVVDPHSGVPVYRQMMDQIRFQIASGMLKPGDELPSTRSLSQRLGVNPMTVSKAYSLLEEEGVVDRRPGLPLVVAALAADSVDRERAEHLKKMLEPAATAARQLGMSTTKAVSVFRRLLDDSTRDPENSR